MIQKIGSLHMTNNNKVTNGTVDFSKEFDALVNRLKERIANDVHDTGYFRNFSENIGRDKPFDFFAKDVALYVDRDEMREGRAFLGVAVLHPTKPIQASTYLINGDRERLLEKLNQPEFIKEIKEQIKSFSDSLKNR